MKLYFGNTVTTIMLFSLIEMVTYTFIKKQEIREVLYFVMFGGVILKILTIEVSRIFT